MIKLKEREVIVVGGGLTAGLVPDAWCLQGATCWSSNAAQARRRTGGRAADAARRFALGHLSRPDAAQNVETITLRHKPSDSAVRR
jgi:hypothetical protein